MKDILECEIFVFDLDRTLFDTYDVSGRKIWAKQLVPPYYFDETTDTITDDVGNICTLRKSVRGLLNQLHTSGKRISFLSMGAIKGYPTRYQPSYQALAVFGILKFFDKKILLYREDKKSENFTFPKNKLCAFFDDSPEQLVDVLSKYPHVRTVDSSDESFFDRLLRSVHELSSI